jgi:1-acyl-sn-glycerol-3-phosphate acyltransferase
VSERSHLPLHLQAVAVTSRVVMSSIARVRASGYEHIPPDGALLVVLNHLSPTDPPLLWGWLARAADRRFRFLAARSLFKGATGRMMRGLGAIPVDTDGGDVAGFRAARAALAAGDTLVLAPEGRIGEGGRLGQPRPGSSLLAVRTGVTVLPVGVSGTDRLFSPGDGRPNIGARVTMRIGPAFGLAIPPGADRRAALAAADTEIMRRIAALVEPRHRGDWEPWPDA